MVQYSVPALGLNSQFWLMNVISLEVGCCYFL